MTTPLRGLLCAAVFVAVAAGPALADPLPVPVVKVAQQVPGGAGGSIQVHLAMSDWQLFSPSLFEPGPTFPRCGTGAANTGISRTAVEIFDAATRKPLQGFCTFKQPQQLQDIVFTAAAAEKPRFVYVIVTDRKLKRRTISAKVKIP
jgi:hypothetical protein